MKFLELVFGAGVLLRVVRSDLSATSHVSISLGKSNIAYNHDHYFNHDDAAGHTAHAGPGSSFIQTPERSQDPGSGPVEIHEPSFLNSDRETSYRNDRYFSVTPFFHSTPTPSYFEFHDHVSGFPYSISSPSPVHDPFSERFHYPSFSIPHFLESAQLKLEGPERKKDVPVDDKSVENDREKPVQSEQKNESASESIQEEEPRSSEGSEQESDEEGMQQEEEIKDNEQKSSSKKSHSPSEVGPKVFHPTEKLHSSYLVPVRPGTLRIPKRKFSVLHTSHFLSVHPHASTERRLQHKLTYNSEDSPGCAANLKDFCLTDDDYPGYEILNAVYEHAGEILNLYADVVDVNPELSTKFKGKSENDKSHLCPTNVTHAQVFRAKNVSGKWRYIVNNMTVHQKTITQVVRLEECKSDGEDCPMVPHCYESKCLQKWAYHRLLVYDPYDHYFPFLIESFKFPAACACHLGKYELKEH